MVLKRNKLGWLNSKTDILSPNSPNKETEMPPMWLSKRIRVVVVAFLCLVVSQILRNHINITIVEMTSNKTITQGNTTIVKPADYDWDSTTVALVISLFPYGGLFSFFGGFIVNRLGSSVTCSVCMLISGIATLLHPVALQLDFRLFLACRFITGLFQAFFYVSIIDMYSQWFPKNERSKLVSFSFNGTNAGVAIVYPICGYLSYRWGWKAVFYVVGILPLIMALICLTTVKNQPCQDVRISKTELDYILEGTSCNGKTKKKTPYKSIFTSGPFWAVCCGLFTYMWIATSLGVTLPLYVKDLTGLNVEEVGWISSIPSCVYFFMVPLAGILMDYCNNNDILSLTRIHKIMISIAFLSAGAFFLANTFISSLPLTLMFFVLTDVLTSSVALILEINIVSLSPNHSGIVGSLTTFFFSLSAIIAAMVTGLLTENHSVEEWNRCYYITSTIAILGAVIFVKFGSSEAQNWTSTPTNNNDQNTTSRGTSE